MSTIIFFALIVLFLRRFGWWGVFAWAAIIGFITWVSFVAWNQLPDLYILMFGGAIISVLIILIKADEGSEKLNRFVHEKRSAEDLKIATEAYEDYKKRHVGNGGGEWEVGEHWQMFGDEIVESYKKRRS